MGNGVEGDSGASRSPSWLGADQAELAKHSDGTEIQRGWAARGRLDGTIAGGCIRGEGAADCAGNGRSGDHAISLAHAAPATRAVWRDRWATGALLHGPSFGKDREHSL